MSLPQPESELHELSVRTVPKFTSFQPSPHNPVGKPQVKVELAQVPQLVPKFSSFKPAASILEHRSNASSGSDGVVHRHYERLRSRSRKRERVDINRSHRHDGNHHNHRDKYRHRDGNRERHQHKRGRAEAEGMRGEGEREKHREKRRHVVNDVDHYIQKQKEPAPSAVFSWDDMNPSGAELFCIDTKGDPANLVYGTIHRYSIPQYYRFGNGGIIGLKSDMKIIHDKGDGKGLILSTREERVEKHKRGINGEKQYRFAISDEKSLRRLRVSAEMGSDQSGIAFESGLAYIPLTSRLKRFTEPSGIHDFDPPLTIEEQDGDGLVYTSPSDDEVDEMLVWNSAKVRQTQLAIQQQVDIDPTKVSAWLALASHQDEVLYNGAGSKRRPTLAERKSSAEIKLSIIDKALKKVPQSDIEGIESLWDCWFDVATEIWEPEDLLSKYQSTLRQYPTMHVIWVKYLDFRQADFNSFKYTEMVECYEQCLEVLRTAVHNKNKDDNDNLRLEEIALYVIFRGFYFMREAGYIENSIAALQGLLELNLFAPREISKHYPPSSHESFDITLDQFRDFWESEVLRAGEEDAEGWYRYVEKGKDGPVPENVQEKDAPEDAVEIDQDDPFGWWVQKEIESNELRGSWPARVVDENEDDPFNVVLFNDISRWMFCFGHEASRKSLIDYMLQFCGLPRWLGSREQPSESLDAFMCCYKLAHQNWFWVGVKERLITWEGMEPEKQGSLIDPFGFRLTGGYPVTLDMLFGRQNGEWVYPMMDSPASCKGRTADIRMARSVLRMVIDGTSINHRDSESLAIFYWALEWRIDPLKAQKLAKRLLKRFRTSLLLYNAYAQIEWRMGNIDMARKIFTTALGMYSTYPEGTRRDAIILWKTWAWEELLDRNHQEALNVLLSIPGGKFDSNRSINDLMLRKADLLRAKRFLIDEQDRFTSLGLVEHASAVNEAMALIDYVSPCAMLEGANMDITKALPIYDSLLEELRGKGLSTSRQFETTLMNGKIRLLYHHLRTSRSFRIASLREALEDAIAELSKAGHRVNTLFWSLYAWNEGRSRIEGRVRGWLRDQIIRPADRDNTVAGYIFTIWTELRMSGNSTHAIRHLFEQAVGCQLTRASAELWKLYIEFEIRKQNPARAKLVLFRALRCCPWSKDIAMFAFTKLMPVLDFDELKKILSISTVEKELRVFNTTALEYYLEDVEDEKGHNLYPGLGSLKGEAAIELPNDQ